MMSVVAPRNLQKFSKAASGEAKATIIEAIGDLSKIEVMQNDVLVATYIRPEKTFGGIYLPDSAIEEDLFQGKVGLVLKMGPAAFNDDERFGSLQAVPGNWVVYRVGDSWDLTLRGTHCRLIRDSNIRLIVNDPEEIF
jgi:co-chaperonin GroES (HSP10)